VPLYTGAGGIIKRVYYSPPLKRGTQGDLKSLSISLYEREKLLSPHLRKGEVFIPL
jgi:hypothetical protein